jgi:predicted transcriptional regulator
MALIAISEAAKLVGRDRKSLYRAIKEGRLSATNNATGARQVDTSELIRVFGSLSDKGDSGATVAMPHDETLSETNATGDLKARIAVLEAENAQLRERIEDKDRHIEDVRNTVRLLEHQGGKKRSWWPWRR